MKFQQALNKWILSGKSGSTVAFPVHRLADKVEPCVDISPAAHALTGYLNSY